MKVWGLFAAIALGALTGAARAEDAGLVRRGEEIVVRLPPRSISSGATLSAPAAGAPAAADGTLLVIGAAGSTGAASLQSTAPPRADKALTPATPELLIRCREIRARIPGALCEPNWVYFAARTPNDPRAQEEYAINTMHLETAWNTTTGSRSILVAVVDTGVDYSHPDLAGNIALNEGEIPSNGRDDDGNGFIDDYVGFNAVERDGDPFDFNEHGTHVAGTIGGIGNNGFGITGVNWSVGLIPVRVLDESGAGTIADIVLGLEYAVARGARIINLSLGGADYSAIFEQGINLAKDADVLVVAAAGNEATNNDFFETFPASFKSSNVLSVAAVDSTNRLAYFSNVGAASVDLGAPGMGILSSIPNGGFDAFDGTSMATPQVSGVAALLLAVNPRFSFRDLRSIILSTVSRAADLVGLTATGGVVDAAAAVSRARTTTPTPLKVGLSVRLRLLSKTLVADVADIDGGRGGLRVTFQCGTSKKMTVTTKRSGRASLRLSRLAVRTPAKCRATTKSFAATVRSKVLKLR